jgi:Helix-hairpin-helix domain/MFS_1 like family
VVARSHANSQHILRFPDMTKLQAPEVRDLLLEIGRRASLESGNPYKVKAYLRAAESLRNASRPLAEMIRRCELREIPGVGDAIAERITNLHRTGTDPTLTKMRAKLPTGVLDLLAVPGLRPDKVLRLHNQLGIGSLDGLEQACREGRLEGVKGRGPALQRKISHERGAANFICIARPSYWTTRSQSCRGIARTQEHPDRSQGHGAEETSTKLLYPAEATRPFDKTEASPSPTGKTVRPALTTVGPFFLLFALLYAAFGAASPFLPALMESKGVAADQIGLMFGASTAIRLISAPLAGRIADQTHALRATLAVCCVGTALAALAYLGASGFWALLAISLLHALALAPTTNLADALALVARASSMAGRVVLDLLLLLPP